MNQRIQELARQAGAQHRLNLGVEEFCFEHHELKKLAELIVHQMLDITDAHTEVFQTERDRALIEHITQSVKQHFGVER